MYIESKCKHLNKEWPLAQISQPDGSIKEFIEETCLDCKQVLKRTATDND